MWLAAADTGPSPVSVFAQYGVVGVVCIVLAVVVRYLYKKLEERYTQRDQDLTAELDRANRRADRLEEQLLALNESVRQSMNALTEANRAVAEAMGRMRRDR